MVGGRSVRECLHQRRFLIKVYSGMTSHMRYNFTYLFSSSFGSNTRFLVIFHALGSADSVWYNLTNSDICKPFWLTGETSNVWLTPQYLTSHKSTSHSEGSRAVHQLIYTHLHGKHALKIHVQNPWFTWTDCVGIRQPINSTIKLALTNTGINITEPAGKFDYWYFSWFQYLP